ncbi:hypothetical protein [Desulfoferrobacter suflitae]|uniref:hypothetical protein n=1 Tax=Desulfoferrobacter suflitae TaxID=2865782 RepID=UPI00216446AB|nr:hypothetical protein [Desulfoferrobacter suflitae]MCK8603206.1 hypothetical protein [Desulfoferrobacter suflitae]
MTSGPEKLGRRSIEEKIRLAHDLSARWGSRLRRDARIGPRLAAVRENVAASRRAMLQVGVAAACRTCEEMEGGSCCGKGIEDKYSPTLLLMNLLLDRVLPTRRYMENSCYFLGPRGCSLAARHVICVNYLCGKIRETIAMEDIIHLQTINGQELDAVFALHEAIKRYLCA